jgi:hypothetical protein
MSDEVHRQHEKRWEQNLPPKEHRSLLSDGERKHLRALACYALPQSDPQLFHQQLSAHPLSPHSRQTLVGMVRTFPSWWEEFRTAFAEVSDQPDPGPAEIKKALQRIVGDANLSIAMFRHFKPLPKGLKYQPPDEGDAPERIRGLAPYALPPVCAKAVRKTATGVRLCPTSRHELVWRIRTFPDWFDAFRRAFAEVCGKETVSRAEVREGVRYIIADLKARVAKAKAKALAVPSYELAAENGQNEPAMMLGTPTGRPTGG